MKKLYPILGAILAVLWMASTASPANAGDTVVHGYYTKQGTYVAPYHRTTPDETRANNYSTQGNVNPWTGKSGTRPLYAPSKPTTSYSRESNEAEKDNESQ